MTPLPVGVERRPVGEVRCIACGLRVYPEHEYLCDACNAPDNGEILDEPDPDERYDRCRDLAYDAPPGWRALQYMPFCDRRLQA